LSATRPQSLVAAFFRLLRLNRSVMVAVICGAGAFVAGAGWKAALWMLLAGWLLAVGGFSLDLYADRDIDRKGPRALSRHNPLADGTLPPAAGLAFSVTFIVASFFLTAWVALLPLVFWALILAVVVGLALHLFETPLARALTLGLLQALYLLMGGAAGRLSWGLGILSLVFFFAMFGGRGMIDIRDFPQDEETPVHTLPKRYGVQRTALFTAVCLCAAFALSLAAYFTREFKPIYLYLDIVFVAIGLVCACLFAARPTPRLGAVLTPIFMMGEGMLISVAMVLGSL
jgi:4-hydroxybenzoate polyprenyltransferase